ncbi:MAG: hypothetical protein ACFCUI_13825 [Bernardetiaceae bacterium]
MKKYLLVFLCVAHFSTMAFSQEPPQQVSDAFKAKFSGAQLLNYIASGGQHILMFKLGNQAAKATFDASGTCLTTMFVVAATDAPESIRDYLKVKYAGEDFKDFWRVEAGGTTLFKANSGSKSITFDGDGGFRSEESLDADALNGFR